MLRRIIMVCLVSAGLFSHANAQELLARVSINASQVGSNVDKKVFQSLQSSLTEFLNTRKWTDDVYQPNEKINCNFLLTVTQADDLLQTSPLRWHFMPTSSSVSIIILLVCVAAIRISRKPRISSIMPPMGGILWGGKHLTGNATGTG